MNDKIAGLPASALAAALLISATSAMAQMKASVVDAKPAAISASADAPKADAMAPGSQEQSAEAEEFELVPLQVGDATQSLLAWQRSGEIASPSPRTITGGVASRSYDRYMKSFEFPIPERLGSTVNKSNSNTSGTSSGIR